MNLVRHAEMINKVSSIMLTHLDVLSDAESIKLATHYSLFDQNGQEEVFKKSLPARIDDWELMQPHYKEL